MKVWTSFQRAIEKRVDFYAAQLERAEEKEALEHAVLCGGLLKDNQAEIQAYMNFKFPHVEGNKPTEATPASDNT